MCWWWIITDGPLLLVVYNTVSIAHCILYEGIHHNLGQIWQNSLWNSPKKAELCTRGRGEYSRCKTNCAARSCWKPDHWAKSMAAWGYCHLQAILAFFPSWAVEKFPSTHNARNACKGKNVGSASCPLPAPWGAQRGTCVAQPRPAGLQDPHLPRCQALLSGAGCGLANVHRDAGTCVCRGEPVWYCRKLHKTCVSDHLGNPTSQPSPSKPHACCQVVMAY